MTGADAMLDQSNWPPAWTRAKALECACTWLSGVDPYRSGQERVIEVAEEFARWLAGNDERRRAGGPPPGGGWFRVQCSDAGVGGPGWMRCTSQGNEYQSDRQDG